MNTNNTSFPTSIDNGLKRRLFYSLGFWAVCTIVCLCFNSYIMVFIEWPYVYAKGVQTSFVSLGPVKELLSCLKSSLTIGLVISGPFVFYGSWKCLFDILHKKDILTRFWAIFSGASFSIGALFYIFVVAPLYFKSVVQVEKGIPTGGTEINMALDPYVSFITAGMLITGLLFHSPMILSLLKLKREINGDSGAVKQ